MRKNPENYRYSETSGHSGNNIKDFPVEFSRNSSLYEITEFIIFEVQYFQYMVSTLACCQILFVIFEPLLLEF